MKEKKHLVEAMAQGLLDKEVLQRHDLVKLLGERPFVSENPQNIDILNEGFKMHYPKTATAPEDETADADEPEDDEPTSGVSTRDLKNEQSELFSREEIRLYH